MFRLAGYLKMTVKQLCEQMDSREFAEWVAIHKFYNPLPDDWRQTGLITAAVLAPHSPRGRTPKPEDFVPIDKAPQHQLQMLEILAKMKEEMDG